MATDRLFLALRPDAPAAARIRELAQRLRAACGLAGQPLPLDRLHLTLYFLGDHAGLPPELLAAAETAAGSTRAARFDIRLDSVKSFVGGRGPAPLVLCRQDGSPPLVRLRRQLETAIARTRQFPADSRAFQPHVTLLYDRQRLAPRSVEPVAWTATEVLLVRSLIGRAQHEVLARYPLR
ncbi:MAG TPA: RNA 2',3'-cyclic phosphodiesterase [Steroidobacteraceae bacterium]|nr:RNA 2',3'-cyclic phosphodiesterase [Steroidobacteraceae bacterium]